MTKFSSPEEFEAGVKEYKLLPFRFSPLDDQRYVLTNLVGEFYVASRPILDSFVRKQLSPTSSAYRDLKSKHFLLDQDSNVALDLLGLKVRTKLSRLADFTSLHIFVVSLRCEHSCPYCQVSRQSDNKVAYDMTESTAQKSLDLVFRSPSPSIKIEFQGGEPLLNFPLVRYVIEAAEKRNEHFRKNLQFVIATNLAVIDDAMLQFCRDHNVLISTSLDGPADLHNSNRPRPGRNSHELALRGIHRAREALGRDKVSALMTTTAASLNRVVDIIDEYVKNDFPGIFLRPLSPYGFAVKTKWISSYGARQWLDFYFEGLDYIISLNRRGVEFREFMASTILTKMLTPFPTGYVDLMSPAGIGIAAVVYNYDGEVFASDEGRMLAEMGDRTFVIGNVHRDTYEQIFTSPRLLEPLEASFASSVPMCSDCAFEPYCGSDPVYHHATQKDYIGHKPTSAFCQRNMAISRRLIDLYVGDRAAREVFDSWIS